MKNARSSWIYELWNRIVCLEFSISATPAARTTGSIIHWANGVVAPLHRSLVQEQYMAATSWVPERFTHSPSVRSSGIYPQPRTIRVFP